MSENYTIEELSTDEAKKVLRWYYYTKIRARIRRALTVNGIEYEDVIQNSYVMMLRFNPPKTVALTTVLSKAMEWSVSNSLNSTNSKGRRDKKHKPVHHLDFNDEVMWQRDDREYPYRLTLLDFDLNQSLEDLSDRDKRIFYNRYPENGGEQATLEEIAEYFGISRQRVNQIIHRILQKLRETCTNG